MTAHVEGPAVNIVVFIKKQKLFFVKKGKRDRWL